jgi:hypothetical protein
LDIKGDRRFVYVEKENGNYIYFVVERAIKKYRNKLC